MPKAVEKPVMQSGAGSTYGRNAAPNAFSLEDCKLLQVRLLRNSRSAASSWQRPQEGLSFVHTSKHPIIAQVASESLIGPDWIGDRA